MFPFLVIHSKANDTYWDLVDRSNRNIERAFNLKCIHRKNSKEKWFKLTRGKFYEPDMSVYKFNSENSNYSLANIVTNLTYIEASSNEMMKEKEKEEEEEEENDNETESWSEGNATLFNYSLSMGMHHHGMFLEDNETLLESDDGNSENSTIEEDEEEAGGGGEEENENESEENESEEEKEIRKEESIEEELRLKAKQDRLRGVVEQRENRSVNLY